MENEYTTIDFDFLKEHIGKDKAEKVTKILGDFLFQKKSVQNPEQTGICTTGGHVVLWAKNDVLNAIKDTDERNTLADILIHDEKVFLDFNRRNFESTVSQNVLMTERMSGFEQSNSDRPCETKGHEVVVMPHKSIAETGGHVINESPKKRGGHEVFWAKDESSKRMKGHEINAKNKHHSKKTNGKEEDI